jgi:hypothetical protein
MIASPKIMTTLEKEGKLAEIQENELRQLFLGGSLQLAQGTV